MGRKGIMDLLRVPLYYDYHPFLVVYQVLLQ